MQSYWTSEKLNTYDIDWQPVLMDTADRRAEPSTRGETGSIFGVLIVLDDLE